MSRVFESCLKSLPQGCFDCVLNDDCAEIQLYEKGRKDAIDEYFNLISTRINERNRGLYLIEAIEFAKQLKGNNK